MRIAVVGGSMAGLFAAHALRRSGHDMHIYERSSVALAGRGAGIVTHRRLHAALASVGLGIDDDFGIRVDQRRVFDRDGTVTAALEFPQLNTSWDGLFDLLRAAMPDAHYEVGKAVVALAATDEHVILTCRDGTTRTVDLVVGADGIRSSVRGLVLPTAHPAYAGYIAWRALVAEADLSAPTRAALSDAFTFCLPPGEQALMYPVAGKNDRHLNLVWYRPAPAGGPLQELLTGTDGRVHDGGIPPPLIRPHILDGVRADAYRVLCPAFAEVVVRCPQLMVQPIYDLTVPQMGIGRVALIGDAAFVARPHVGAGVTKAAEDAVALSEALAQHGDLATALAAFNAARHPTGDRIIAQARRLGTGIGSPAPPSAQDVHAVMRDTASLAFLDRG